MKRSQVITIIIAVVILGGALGAYLVIESLGEKTDIAPDFELIDMDGVDFNISSYQPKTLILDFMSKTCAPCKTLYPRFADLLIDENLTGKIEIVSLETNPYITDDQILEEIAEQNITWRVARASSEIMQAYDVSTIPQVFIIDGEGFIKYLNNPNDLVNPLPSFDTLKEECLKAIAGEGETQSITSSPGFVIGTAIVTAVLSFFSPCSFPLLPSYVAHVLSVKSLNKKEDENEIEETVSKIKPESKKEGKLKSSLQYSILGLGTSSGILIVYLIVGVIVTLVSSIILNYFDYALPVIGGIFIIVGILMFTSFEISFSRILGKLRLKQMNVEKEQGSEKSLSRMFQGTFFYGLGYGLASLGCSIGMFLFFSAEVAKLDSIIYMVLAYFIFVLTIILLVIGVTLLISASKDLIIQKLKSSTKILKILSGVIMVIVGIYLIIEFLLTIGVI